MSDLSELFARDPLSLTKEDRKVIIDYYRSARASFAAGIKAPKAEKPKKEKVNLDINLDELDLS